MDLVELSRLCENLVRIGTIHSVDHPARRCRVQCGKLTSEWLRWMEYRAGETTTWNPPTVGEQCVVLSPSGDFANGIVFYGAPSDVIDTPSHDPVKHVTRFPDGTTVTYDHAEGLHEASYPDGAVISYHHPSSHLQAVGIVTGLVQAGEKITFDTPLVHITGQCVIDNLLTYNNGLRGYGGDEGNLVTGNFIHGEYGVLSSYGKVLHTHVHTGVQAGPSNTGQPA